jgi:hypothetical protein
MFSLRMSWSLFVCGSGVRDGGEGHPLPPYPTKPHLIVRCVTPPPPPPTKWVWMFWSRATSFALVRNRTSIPDVSSPCPSHCHGACDSKNNSSSNGRIICWKQLKNVTYHALVIQKLSFVSMRGIFLSTSLFCLLVHSRCRGFWFFTWSHSDTHHSR